MGLESDDAEIKGGMLRPLRVGGDREGEMVTCDKEQGESGFRGNRWFL